ncbi:MAG TPA: hypothetical protein VMI31_13985, partial [Fimbriimonadaceae bacterium]|nr:hypothetical protein [Fimbriimonadaceae bacterium]
IPPLPNRWEASAGQYVLSVDDETGCVSRYTDCRALDLTLYKPGRRAQAGPPFYRSEKDVIARAAATLDRLGWHHGPDSRMAALPKPGAAGTVSRSEIRVVFFDRPYGFPTDFSGNRSDIGLDSLTGGEIELTRSTGYTYSAAKVKITPAQAIAIARRAIELSAAPRIVGPRYRTLSPIDRNLSPAARRMALAKLEPLIYEVSGKQQDAWIDAATGEILERHSNAVEGVHRPRL